MDDMAVRIAECDARSKANSHRLDAVEAKQEELDKIVTAVSLMSQEQVHIKTDLAEIKTDVKTLAAKPAKLVDGMVEKFIFGIVGALAVIVANIIFGG